MAAAAPCKRHQPRTTGYRVHCVRKARNRALPIFAVYRLTECSRCGETDFQELATVKALDEHEAALKAGVPEKDLPKPAQTAAAPSKPAVTVAGIGWPFPVSTRFNPDGSPKEATT